MRSQPKRADRPNHAIIISCNGLSDLTGKQLEAGTAEQGRGQPKRQKHPEALTSLSLVFGLLDMFCVDSVSALPQFHQGQTLTSREPISIIFERKKQGFLFSFLLWDCGF